MWRDRNKPKQRRQIRTTCYDVEKANLDDFKKERRFLTCSVMYPLQKTNKQTNKTKNKKTTQLTTSRKTSSTCTLFWQEQIQKTNDDLRCAVKQAKMATSSMKDELWHVYCVGWWKQTQMGALCDTADVKYTQLCQHLAWPGFKVELDSSTTKEDCRNCVVLECIR